MCCEDQTMRWTIYQHLDIYPEHTLSLVCCRHTCHCTYCACWKCFRITSSISTTISAVSERIWHAVGKWYMNLFMGTVGRGISRQDHGNITRKRARAPESKAFPHHEVPIQRYRQKRSGWRHVSVIRAHCITLSAHTSMSSIHSIDFLDWLRSVLSWSWSNHLEQRERAC